MKTIAIVVTIVLFALSATAQRSFYDKEFKVGFTIPASARTSRDPFSGPDQKMKSIGSFSFKDARGIPASFADVFAGTMTKDECSALSKGFTEKPRIRKYGSTTFTMTEETQGGTESEAPQQHYTNYHDGACYEVTFSIPEARHTTHKYNESAAYARMRPILSTMYFRR